MTVEDLPKDIRQRYEVHEWKHACAILKGDFPEEWNDLIEVLRSFQLLESHIVAAGGSKSEIATSIDKAFYARGWVEKGFDIRINVDGEERLAPTHKVDCYKNKIAVEIEWNNKDPFYDRDLNNFRLLFDLRAISVGIIITRSDVLDEHFRRLGRYTSFGQATTHIGKLLPKIEGGGGGGCPILVFGIRELVQS